MSDQQPSPPKKRSRGAQPGNFNALKHGFYSRQFRSREHIDLDALLTEDIAECLATLKAISAASARLTNMLRVQKLIGKSNDIPDLITQAIAEVNQELNLARRFTRNVP
jgi:hypothetical protein